MIKEKYKFIFCWYLPT